MRAVKSKTSQQLEASILQNIGAAYNEKGMHAESLAYHIEAAALHSKPVSIIVCIITIMFSISLFQCISLVQSIDWDLNCLHPVQLMYTLQ